MITMDSDKILRELDAIADMSPEQSKQVLTMINGAYIGIKLDTEYVESNITAYSALNSKAVLVVISNVISKEIGQKAIEIVAFIRSTGRALSDINLLDVLGTVQPRMSAETQAFKKDLEAWEQAYAEVAPVDLNAYDLETDEGFNKAIDAIVERNEQIAERAAIIKQEVLSANINKAAQVAYVAELDELRKSILSGAVNEVVTTILKRYATLYSDLFVNPAMGVITPRGIMGATIDNSVRNVHMESAVVSVSIFNIISQLLGDSFKVPGPDKFDILPVDGDGKVRSDLFNMDGTCNYSYLPKLQAHLVVGIHRHVTRNGNAYVENGGFSKAKSYGAFNSAIMASLSCDISKIINRVFKEDKDIMACIPRLNVLKDSLIRLYTTTFIAEEVVPNKVIRMRMSCLGAENQLLGVSRAFIDAGNIGLGTDVASADELNNTITNGVLKLTMSLDKEAFTQESLFAYEVLERVYESGNTVDMGAIVVGRKLSGELMTINLSSLGSVVVSVQGAGRSGKGVLTLSMLATMVGSGCPFIYIDNKPDMAALLWQLEREYGTKILSVDITGKTTEIINTAGGGTKEVSPIRRGTAYNMPTGISSDMYWSAFAYAKLATLYTIAMHCKGTGKIPELDALPLFFAIFDEASSASKVLQKNFVEVTKVLKADKKNAQALKIKGFLESLSAGLGAIFSNYPDRGLKIMVLSQSWNTDTWKDPAADGKTPQMFYPLLYGASMRILGTDNTGSQQNALGEATVQGKSLISPETMGHFAFVPKNRALEDDTAEVFKSYLVLNNNDFDTSGQGQHGKYVGGMLSNLKTKPTVLAATSDKIAPGGVPEERIGFSGLLKYIGAKGGIEVAEKLGVGYKIMDAVANLIGITGEGGRYVDLEDWLYDCTPDTFWSYAELKNLVDTGARVTDVVSESEEPQVKAVTFDEVPEPQYIPQPMQVTTATQVNVNDLFAGRGMLLDDGIPDTGEVVDGSIFDFPEPEPVQQQLQFGQKQQPQKPYIYIDDVPFTTDEQGNLHFVTGRYAPPQNVQPDMFNGQRYTAPPIIETNGKLPFTEVPNGAYVLNDPESMVYAQPLDGGEASFTGKFKPLFANMPIKKLETALAHRWYVLMHAGAKMVGGVGLVARVTVTEHTLSINGIPVHATESIIGDTGLRITDVVNYEEMFKYFKDLRQLDLDFPARISFGTAYSNPAIAFTQSKSLQVIYFKDSTGKVIQFTRQHASQKLDIPEDKLNSRFNTWSKFASQVNKGQTSSFCKPGSRLLMADYTKRLAVGAFGPGSTWSKKRRAFGTLALLACAAGTVVTGGVQAARAVQAKHH